MEIKQLIIENWKSIEKLELINPNPFSVFVGPNASGKSNIFEALSYINYNSKINRKEVDSMFGGISNFKPKSDDDQIFEFTFLMKTGKIEGKFKYHDEYRNNRFISGRESVDGFFNYETLKEEIDNLPKDEIEDYKQFYLNFSHLFINKKNFEKISSHDDTKLSGAAFNLPKVLKRILSNKNKREEIVEWLQLLIPGFENLEIKSEELSGTDNLLIYERGTNKPFPGNLISDGTYNILALITAVYQSDEPQFLLIEEPENGLNPKVIKELVNLFRQKCEEEGHFIWLNTHSQTLVNQLKENEIILVDKLNGATKVKQLKKGDSSGLPMDEAWLTNTLGGGIPW